MNEGRNHIGKIEELKRRAKAKYERLKPSSDHKESVDKAKMLKQLELIELMSALDKCKVSDGPSYEELVKIAFIEIFGELVDRELVDTQVELKGRHADIELPFCDEMLGQYIHWTIWRNQYKIERIIVEVKNLKKKAQPADVGQLKHYVDLNAKGKMAFLVSRNGFSPKALKTLKAHNENGYLLLPLDHKALKILIELSMKDSEKVKIMQYLRRISWILSRQK